MSKINMHVLFCWTPTVHRSSVSNMPCLHLAHHSDLARVKSQAQRSRTEKSTDSIHTEVFTNALRLSCAQHPPRVKSRKAPKDRTMEVKSPFQCHGFAKYRVHILRGVMKRGPISSADFMPGCVTSHIAQQSSPCYSLNLVHASGALSLLLPCLAVRLICKFCNLQFLQISDTTMLGNKQFPGNLV